MSKALDRFFERDAVSRFIPWGILITVSLGIISLLVTLNSLFFTLNSVEDNEEKISNLQQQIECYDQVNRQVQIAVLTFTFQYRGEPSSQAMQDAYDAALASADVDCARPPH
jgi:hypothetical protein